MKNFYSLKSLILGAALTVAGNFAFAQSSYKLVTSVNDLESTAKYVLASGKTGDVRLMGYQNTNNRPQNTSDVTVSSDSKISVSPATVSTNQTDAYEITLSGVPGAWVLNDAVNNTILGPAPTGNNNHLKANSATTFTIAVNEDNEVVFTAVTGTNANGRNIVRYNSSASLFACYSSGQNAVFLFKKEEATQAVNDASKAKTTLVKNTVVANEIIFGAAARVSVYNTAGQVVKTAEVVENGRLDVSALPKGNYIVTGVVNGQTVSQKIIKK